LPSAGRPRPTQVVSALDGVSFDVHPGEIVGVIGRNGAGKTTLLKVLSRITEPTDGTAEIHGRVGTLLEVGTGFHPELTGRENVYLSGAVLGMTRAEIREQFDAIVSFAEVERFIDTPLKRYSAGMYLRLAFAVAAHLRTEIMLVDEILAVGDLEFRQRCLGEMRNVGRGGRTVVYISHDMSSIRQLCTRVIWLDKGRIVDDGPPAEVTSRYEAHAYRGIEESGGVFARDPAQTRGKRLWIDKVEIRDDRGDLSTSFKWGDTLRLVATLGGRAPADGYTVDWSIQNDRGERVSFGTANPQQNVYFDREDRVIECALGPLWLTSGKYRFWLSIWVWGQTRWDTWEEAGTFRIANADPFGTGFDATSPFYGSVVIPHTWRSLLRDGTTDRA
jgi:lipopolysaccharide transport system ATP-binding protein